MQIIVRQLNTEQFTSRFSNEEECLKFLSEEKWANGYTCKKCGHTNHCKGKSPYSRRCTRCKHEESAMANTIFHRCHIPIAEAFRIVYMVCHDPSVSTYKLSREVDLRQMTCWKLKNRLMECVKNRGDVDILYHEKKL